MEVFHRGQRVAATRRYGGPRHGTLPDHMPSAHRLYAEWNPKRFQSQARAIGPRGADHRRAARGHTRSRGSAPASASCVSSRHRCCSGRGCLCPSRGDRRAQLPERRLHHRAQARWQDGAAHRGRAPIRTPTSAVPATTIEENNVAQHPTSDRLREARPGGHGQEPA